MHCRILLVFSVAMATIVSGEERNETEADLPPILQSEQQVAWGRSCVCQQECSDRPSGLNITVLETIAQTLLATQASQAALSQEVIVGSQAQVRRVNDLLAALAEDVEELSRNVTEVKDTITKQQEPPPGYNRTYRLFLVESDEGNYQYSLAEARQACSDRNMKLATMAQLMAAFKQGYDMCSCGWLDSGTAHYVVQWPRDGCGGKGADPGVRTCDWQSTWNAYCFTDASLW